MRIGSLVKQHDLKDEFFWKAAIDVGCMHTYKHVSVEYVSSVWEILDGLYRKHNQYSSLPSIVCNNHVCTWKLYMNYTQTRNITLLLPSLSPMGESPFHNKSHNILSIEEKEIEGQVGFQSKSLNF